MAFAVLISVTCSSTAEGWPGNNCKSFSNSYYCNYIYYNNYNYSWDKNDAVKQCQTLQFMAPCVWDKKTLRISRLKHYRSTYYCANVNNQQDATTFSFINLFNLTLHISGDKFAHPQEHFLTVYTVFGTMHRHCCRPAAVSVHCTKNCIYSQKVLLRMGEFVARNM